MTPAPASTTQDGPDRGPPPLALREAAAATQELFGAWAYACSAWGDYLIRLATASGPLAVFDAGTQLMTDSLEVCSRVAAARLGAGGIGAPLLNDP